MSDTNQEFNDAPLTVEEKHTALFAQMVMQSASMALMFMGRTPNPVSGKTETDLDAARMFIEQLEMLEIRTKGNLTPDEQRLLKQNLMTVRLSFVQAVEEAGKKPQVAEARTQTAPADAAPQAEEQSEASKKKFSKSYGEG
jgi:hypothetical protein